MSVTISEKTAFSACETHLIARRGLLVQPENFLSVVADTAAVNAADIAVAESPLRTYLCDK